MNNQDYEEIEDLGRESTTFFIKTKEGHKLKYSISSKLLSQLGIEENEKMQNRKVEITQVTTKQDGFFQSHKEYTIVSYILDKDDNKIDRIEIRRRYSDFEWLVNQLTTKYPAFIIPPLPEKNPLGKIYNEDAEFIENRQKGLLYFLNKMLEHPALRNTNDFVQFLTAYDTEFVNIVSKKSQSYLATLSNVWDSLPSIPSTSFITNVFSKFVESDKPKREKSREDAKIEQTSQYLEFLTGIITELIQYADQLAIIENEQGDTLLDISNNLLELDKCYKETLTIAEKICNSTEECSKVQKDHSKVLQNDIEVRLKAIKSYIYSASEAIKRRNDLKNLIDTNDTKILEMERSGGPKYTDLVQHNQQLKEQLKQITLILTEELTNFENNISLEIDAIARDFMNHQVLNSQKMFMAWSDPGRSAS